MRVSDFMERMSITSQQILDEYRDGRRDFSSVRIIDCNLDDKDLSGIIFRNADLSFGSLRGSKLNDMDMLFVFSVGGGDLEKNISPNLVRALEFGKSVGATIAGIVGRDGGYTARVVDACVVVPTVNPNNITAHTESFQALVWHLMVMHPSLQSASMKWESVSKK